MNLKEQREKVLSGQMYNDLTDELIKAVMKWPLSRQNYTHIS